METLDDAGMADDSGLDVSSPWIRRWATGFKVSGEMCGWENEQVVLGLKRFSYKLGNCVG